jgi:hypothetical protein
MRIRILNMTITDLITNFVIPLRPRFFSLSSLSNPFSFHHPLCEPGGAIPAIFWETGLCGWTVRGHDDPCAATGDGDWRLCVRFLHGIGWDGGEIVGSVFILGRSTETCDRRPSLSQCCMQISLKRNNNLSNAS